MASIAELLIAQGRTLADTRRRRGERAGALVTSLGQIPGAIIADRDAERAARVQAARQAAADARAQTQTNIAASAEQRQIEAARLDAQALEDAKLQEQRGKQAVLGWMKQHAATIPEADLSRMQAILEMPGGAKHLAEGLAKAPEPYNLQAFDPTKDIRDPRTGALKVAGVPEAPKVTFGAPARIVVDGKLRTARPGSDDQWYIGGHPVVPKQGEIQLYDKPDKAESDKGSVDPKMSIDYRNALERSIMSVPEYRRGSVIAHANDLWREGNLPELKEVIQQAATESENVDMKNQVRGRQATIDALADVRSMIEQMQREGVPTNILTGTVEDVARKLGTSTNPKYAEFSTALMGTLIQYRRAATGVQFSQRESGQYEKMFPNYSQTLPVNLATIRGLERQMRINDQTYWKGKLGASGAALLGIGAPSPPAPPKPRPGALPAGVPPPPNPPPPTPQQPPPAPPGWKYVPKAGGGWTAVEAR